MQLRRGARQALDYLTADLNDIDEYAHDPEAVRQLVARCLRRVREDIEPHMLRAAPTVDQRLEQIERRLEQLEAGRIIVERAAPN